MSLEKKAENLIQVEINKHKVDNDLSFTLTEIGRIQLDITLVIQEVADIIRERIAELREARKRRLEKSTGRSTLDELAIISFAREERQLIWVLGLLVEPEGEMVNEG